MFGPLLQEKFHHVYNTLSIYRYPKVTKHCAEGLKLWPAYVCWARGHVRQATDLFMEAVSTLKDSQ